jgi:hypothetical protein
MVEANLGLWSPICFSESGPRDITFTRDQVRQVSSVFFRNTDNVPGGLSGFLRCLQIKVTAERLTACSGGCRQPIPGLQSNG